MKVIHKDPSSRLKTVAIRGLLVAGLATITVVCFSLHCRPVVSACACAETSGGILKALGATTNRLIFVSDRTGNFEIYEKDLISGKTTPLTSGPSNNMNPEISPDGKSVVFYSDRSGKNQIHGFNLLHPNVVSQLTHDTNGVNNYDPVFTPDGKTILFKKTDSSGNFGNIWVMNTDGSGQKPVTTSLTSHGQEGWKPAPINNSRSVITIRGHQGDLYSDNLYTVNLRTGVKTQITNNSLTNWFPDYSAQAGKIVFITKQKHGGQDILDTMRSDGGDSKTIVTMRGDNDDPSWTPDGRHIIFINDGSGSFNVYAVSAKGGCAKLLDESPPGSKDLSPLLVPFK